MVFVVCDFGGMWVYGEGRKKGGKKEFIEEADPFASPFYHLHVPEKKLYNK